MTTMRALGAAGQFDEAGQDFLVVLAVFVAADDDEVAVFCCLVRFGFHVGADRFGSS